jgi:hypothetical protein
MEPTLQRDPRRAQLESLLLAGSSSRGDSRLPNTGRNVSKHETCDSFDIPGPVMGQRIHRRRILQLMRSQWA